MRDRRSFMLAAAATLVTSGVASACWRPGLCRRRQMGADLLDKRLRIISDDPLQVIYVSPGGDIGLPFFRLSDQIVNLTQDGSGVSYVNYYATVTVYRFLHHDTRYPGFPSPVFIQLSTDDNRPIGGMVQLGGVFSATCNATLTYVSRARISSSAYSLAAKASVTIGDPPSVIYC